MEDEEEFKELFTAAPSAIPEKDIQHYSRYLRDRTWPTEQEARDWFFDTLEHWDKQSWSGIFGKSGTPQNRWMADNIPAYRTRHGQWKIGRPLMTWTDQKRKAAYERRKEQAAAEEKRREAEFKRAFPGWTYRKGMIEHVLSSTFSSDFSDGTNGEPTGSPMSPGDIGTNVGLPDYKYVERKHAEKNKRLRQLLQRRDPQRVSKNPHDIALRQRLGEEEEENLGKELDAPEIVLRPQAESEWAKDHFAVEFGNGQFLGAIYRDTSQHKTTPTLRRLWNEFPWIALARGFVNSTRHRTKEAAVAYLRDVELKLKNAGFDSPEYHERQSELSEVIDDEDFQAVHPGDPHPVGYVCQNTETKSYFGRNTVRTSDWTPYLGDAKIFKFKQSWYKWDRQNFDRGYWRIIPIYHDPSKYGERALSPETPKRFFPRRPAALAPDDEEGPIFPLPD